MPRLPVAAALALLFLTACSRTMDDSDIKQNPHPKQAYDITVTLRDAPGPFDSVRGEMAFEVENHECVPQDPFSGARKVPTHYPAFELRPAGDGTYRGTVYLDLLRDSDYFGLGRCRWHFTGLLASFQAYGVRFVGTITDEDVRSGEPTTQFIAKKLFRPSDIEDFGVNGVPMSDYVRAHPDDFFSMTLIAKERRHGSSLE
ncbi:MAG: hypothetical protein AB1832_15780 [Pseudomonadota bacterium]